MKKKDTKNHKVITLLIIMVIGSGLYLVIQNGFDEKVGESQTQSTASDTLNDSNGHHLKTIKQHNEEFSVKSIEKQDRILYQTKKISVSKNEKAKKQKVTDAMENTLDKKIIGEVSNLQNDAQPLKQANELNQKIQHLKSLSKQSKAQFGQEIEVIKQNVQMTN